MILIIYYNTSIEDTSIHDYSTNVMAVKVQRKITNYYLGNIDFIGLNGVSWNDSKSVL